jgi:hypothetical protein
MRTGAQWWHEAIALLAVLAALRATASAADARSTRVERIAAANAFGGCTPRSQDGGRGNSLFVAETVDTPSLTRKLCDGQRRPYVANFDGTGRELGDLATAGRWAAATAIPAFTPAKALLRRCGAKPRTLKVCSRASRTPSR